MNNLEQQLHLSNCPTCGELFLKNQNNKCKNCQKDLNSKIKVLRKTLHCNHDVNVSELQEATNLSKDSIVNILKESNLVDYNSLEISCKLCGKPVKVASRKLICEKCTSQLASGSKTVERIEKLRETARTKSKIAYLENNATKLVEKTIITSSGFNNKTPKSGFKLDISDDRPIEVELLPEPTKNTNLKLSNNCKVVNDKPRKMIITKKKIDDEEKISPKSLKSKVKDHLARFIESKSSEIEILPDIINSSNLKLSNNYELAHLIVYN